MGVEKVVTETSRGDVKRGQANGNAHKRGKQGGNGVQAGTDKCEHANKLDGRDAKGGGGKQTDPRALCRQWARPWSGPAVASRTRRGTL